MLPNEVFSTSSLDSSLKLYQLQQVPPPKNLPPNTNPTPQWAPRLISSVKTDSYGITCSSVSFSNSMIVTGGADGAIQLYSLSTHRFLRQFPTSNCSEVLALEFCADAPHYKIISSDADYIRIWDLRDKNKTASYPLKSGGPVRSILCVENLLVLGHTQGIIRIIDTRFNRPESSVPASINTSRRPSVEGREQSLSVRTSPNSNKLKHLATLESHTQPVIGLSLSNQTLVSCSLDWTVKIWKFPWLTNGHVPDDASLEIVEEPEESLDEHLRGVLSVKVKDEKIVSGGEDKELRIWDGSDRECEWWCVNKIRCKSPVRCLDFDDSKIIVGGEDGAVRIWDFRNKGGKEESLNESWSDWAMKLF